MCNIAREKIPSGLYDMSRSELVYFLEHYPANLPDIGFKYAIALFFRKIYFDLDCCYHKSWEISRVTDDLLYAYKKTAALKERRIKMDMKPQINVDVQSLKFGEILDKIDHHIINTNANYQHAKIEISRLKDLIEKEKWRKSWIFYFGYSFMSIVIYKLVSLIF